MSIDLTKITVTIYCLALLSSVLKSATSEAAEVEFSGFANIGLTYSQGDTLRFRSSLLNRGRSDLTLAPDSVLGLQTNIKFSDKLDFVGQVILQDRTDHILSNYLEQAFLRYQINRNWSAKVGRISTNSYLFTDYRYVGQLLNWVRPPIEMYSTAGSLGNMDGAQASYITDTDFGAIKLALAYGNSVFNNDQASGEVGFDYSDLTVFNIEFQATDWRLQAAYLQATLDNFQNPGLDELKEVDQMVPVFFLPFVKELVYNLVPDGRKVTYASIGGQYHFEQLELIAEFADYDSDWLLAGGSQSGYVTAAYHIDNVTPFITLAFYNRDEEPQALDYAAAASQLPQVAFQQLVLLTAEANEAVRNASIDQQSISLGVKWEFHPQWSFKMQADHFRINQYGSGFFAVNQQLATPATDVSYNVFNISLTSIF